jgi:hypothetical protein
MVTEPIGSHSAATNNSSTPNPQPASWSHNLYFNPNSVELAGLQSPGLQSPASHSPTHGASRQQQQQLAAPGMQAMHGGAGVGAAQQQWAAVPRPPPPQQQQQLPRTFSSLGGAPPGSAVVSPDHVGLELPAAAVANGNSWGSGSSKLQQQQVDMGLTSPRAVAQPLQQQQQQQRSSQPGGVGPELAPGFGAGVSAQTEYHDAKSRQSEGSWASGREDTE